MSDDIDRDILDAAHTVSDTDKLVAATLAAGVVSTESNATTGRAVMHYTHALKKLWQQDLTRSK